MITTTVKVRFYETDMMGVVHHSNHIRWLELGRVSYLNAAGITLAELLERGYVFPILSVECQYHHAAHYDDVVRIETTLESMSRAQMTFTYRLVRESDGALLATGRSKGAIADGKTGRIVRLEGDLYDRIAAFTKEDAGHV